MVPHYVDKAGLELLCLDDPPVSAQGLHRVHWDKEINSMFPALFLDSRMSLLFCSSFFKTNQEKQTYAHNSAPRLILMGLSQEFSISTTPLGSMYVGSGEKEGCFSVLQGLG